MSFLAWPAASSMPGAASTAWHALLPQLIQALMDGRIGELEIAVLHRHARQALA